MRPFSLLLGREASLCSSERLLLFSGDWVEAGAFLSADLGGVRGDGWPRVGCCCALQYLLLLFLRDGEWGCGVGGWLRIGGLEIKSSSMNACMSVAYEETTEVGLRTTKSSDRGENKAWSLSESDEMPQTISSSSEVENTENWLPSGGESNSKD
ncbi:hypothetical protein BJ322DRAFT_1029297 [Thelephora terrestris]|uniref:Uncharacterized protein n=1 Tax=Thelephora terrestris TaxID=56493 RepID=A0A9P6HQ29_9AGAM|nr:hypothetical protein BJ322DRAFT_1029297 [Thelephora terrestris]